MQKLLRYPKIQHENYQVQAGTAIVSGHLEINFQVNFKNGLQTSEQFKKDSYENWGLWEFDVVEAFLTRSEKKLPYLEVQISPLGQTFALLVERPRDRTSYPVNLEFESDSKIEGEVWMATLRIPLGSIPGESSKIFGNLTSCLGKIDQREYFGLKTLDKIDFHLIQLFDELGEIK